MDWSAIFLPSVPLLEGVIRGTVIFLALYTMTRLAGQRESGALGITDILVVVLVAQGAAPGLNGHASSVTDALVLVATILLWSVALDAVTYRFPRIAPLLKATPRPLIEDGQLNRQVMRREFMTHEEVMSQLRLHGIEDIDEVKRARLEPNGMISVVRLDDAETEPVEPPKTL